MFHSREFELDLISFCLKRPLFFRQHKDKLLGLKFQDKYLNILWKHVTNLASTYTMVPTQSEMQKYIADNISTKYDVAEVELVSKCVEDIYERNITDFTGTSISNYIVEDEAKKLAQELLNNKGETLALKLRELENKVGKLKYLYSDDEDLGLNFFSDEGIEESKKLLEAYNSFECISTGNPLLDKQLNGGYRIGELWITIGTTCVGKTAWLLNQSMNLVKSGKRVVYLVLDNLAGEIISRTLGCAMNKDITTSYDVTATMDELSESLKDKYRNRLFFKHYSPREVTRTTVEKYLSKLRIYLYELDKAEGVLPEEEWGVIHALVFDYMDLMLPESGASEFWIGAEHLSQELKALLKTNRLLGLTATQGGTEAMKSDTLKLYQAAGAKSKFNAPDGVMAMSQTEDEKQMSPSVFRLGVLKARRAKVNYQIKFRFEKEKQRIYEDPDTNVVLSMSGVNLNEFGQTLEKKISKDDSMNLFFMHMNDLGSN